MSSMSSTVTETARPSEDAFSGAAYCDTALLDQITLAQVAQNRAHAERLELVHTFHARRVAEHEAGGGEPEFIYFQLTPLRETQAEISPLLGTSDQMVQVDIDTVADMHHWLPRLWERCRSGRLDLSRALTCHEQLTHLATDADRAAYAGAIQDWFDKHDPPDNPDGQLCRLPRTKIQRAARYQRLKLPQRSDRETFAEAFERRAVHLRVDEESGMSTLCGRLAAHDAITADHRLTLIAKHRAQEPGETRTLAQLRADSLLDLIHGRITAPATTGDLEHHEACGPDCRGAAPGQQPEAERAHGPTEGTGDGRRRCPLHPEVLTTDTGGPIGGYARPVVNVTVPITTLLGVDEQPGLLSGSIAVPPDLARHIAADPTGTWYRMLTDPAGGYIALSTKSYQPTQAIKNSVDARDQACVFPSCSRPAVECAFDHRVPYPEGETSVRNGQPLCERHHQVKHARGFGVVRNDDGSYTWTTRHGSTFTTPAAEQPAASWPFPRTDRPERTGGTVGGTASSPDENTPRRTTARRIPRATADLDETFHQLVGPLERELARLVAAPVDQPAAR